MNAVIAALSACLANAFRARTARQIEILALRHQLATYQRSAKRPRIKPADRILWSWIARLWPGWRECLVIVQPRTVIAWQRRRFRDHWRRLSHSGKPGRPTVARELRDLIRRMSSANPLWGAPRIVCELRKIGIDVVKSTVEKYMLRSPKPSTPTWMTFLRNHAPDMISIDFFVVPTVRYQHRGWALSLHQPGRHSPPMVRYGSFGTDRGTAALTRSLSDQSTLGSRSINLR
jgi:hypothetical protein